MDHELLTRGLLSNDPMIQIQKDVSQLVTKGPVPQRSTVPSWPFLSPQAPMPSTSQSNQKPSAKDTMSSLLRHQLPRPAHTPSVTSASTEGACLLSKASRSLAGSSSACHLLLFLEKDQYPHKVVLPPLLQPTLSSLPLPRPYGSPLPAQLFSLPGPPHPSSPSDPSSSTASLTQLLAPSLQARFLHSAAL